MKPDGGYDLWCLLWEVEMQPVDGMAWEVDDRWEVVYLMGWYQWHGWRFVLDDLSRHDHLHDHDCVHPVMGGHTMPSLPSPQHLYLGR